MRTIGLMSCAVFGVFGFAVACGGSDGTNLTTDGGDDSGQGVDSGQGDSGQGGDSGNPGDAGSDAQPVTCDGGLMACGGTCVDTSTDMQNCGGCGVVCNTQCVGGVCQLLGGQCDAGIGQVGDNACLTIDSKNVYWASGFANGSVWSVPLGGGCPSLVVGSQALPHGMASDGTNLFFADQGASAGTGSVQRIPIGGGSPTPIATNQSTPLDVVVDGTNVYWTNAGDGSVWKSDKTTPNPIKLAGPSGQGHATHLRVDATNVYFTDHTAGLVKRVPIAGGNVDIMTTAVTGVGYLAIDSKNAYFGAYPQNSAALLSVGLAATTTAPTSLISSGLAFINGVETDGTSLWYAEQSSVKPYQPNTGEVHRATVAGQNDATLASKQNGPNCIAVDSTSVYWINAGGGMISKTGK